VLLNVSLILSAVYLSQYTQEPVIALAWGVFIGGFVQLCLQFPFLRRIHIWPKLLIDWSDPGVRRILKLMLPAIVGASVMQINLLVDTLFASFLPVGSLSWLYYADRITELPLGMFGVALATVALPNLSAQFAKRNEVAFNRQLQWALKMCLLVATPAAIGLWFLASPILATLFFRGAFSAVDVDMASRSLRMLSVGLVAFMMIKVMVSAFYARQNTRFPVKIAMIALATNIFFNALLIQSMAHAGLSLASSISALLQVTLLGWALFKQNHFVGGDWWPFSLRLVFASTSMMFLLIWFVPELDVWLDLSTWDRASRLLMFISMAMCVYTFSLWITGMRFQQLSPENT
jgi:putative peptidoglycan lipid II flippase